MKNIGIVLPNLGNCQLSYLVIGQINEILQSGKDMQFTIFCEDFSRHHMKALCPVVNVLLAASFDGLIITTNLSTTAKILNTIHKSKHLFYVWDLEWIRNKNQNYLQSWPIYNSVSLFTRSEPYAKAIRNYTNKEVTIIPDFNLYELSRSMV
jgi:hypothetical protein